MTWHDKTRLDRARQGKARQEKTIQGKARQDTAIPITNITKTCQGTHDIVREQDKAEKG